MEKSASWALIVWHGPERRIGNNLERLQLSHWSTGEGSERDDCVELLPEWLNFVCVVVVVHSEALPLNMSFSRGTLACHQGNHCEEMS